MASYKVILKPSVEKDVRSFPKSVVARLLKQIKALKNRPFPRNSVKLGGAEHLYRLRVGDYRIVYGVDMQAKQITIHYARHRREAYRQL